MKRSIKKAESDYRPSVGIMLLNRDGHVLVARRNDVSSEAWQMPQGGIDAGEDPREAAFRELREEIGTDKAEIIAESQTWLRYDLPKELVGKVWDNKRWRGQRQKWLIMRFTGSDTDINLETMHPEFSAWKWVPVRTLPSMVVSFKRQVYLDLLAEFPDIGRSLEHRLSTLLEEPIVRATMAADSVDEQELYELLRRVSQNLNRRET